MSKILRKNRNKSGNVLVKSCVNPAFTIFNVVNLSLWQQKAFAKHLTS